MDRPPQSGNRLFRAASLASIVAAGGHALGHFLVYMDIGSFDSRRREVYALMASYPADPVLHGSLWRVLQMFSLSFIFLHLFVGLVGLWALRQDVSAATLRSLTRLLFGFWLLALALFAGLHPVIQPIVISATLALLYGLSLWRQRRVV